MKKKHNKHLNKTLILTLFFCAAALLSARYGGPGDAGVKPGGLRVPLPGLIDVGAKPLGRR